MKALFFFRFRLKKVWFLGFFILVFLILISFLGYVIVGAQISFWAGIVITRLLRVIPFFGLKLIFFFWGRYIFRVNSIKFFFFFHFFFPLILIFLVGLHLFFLHFYGRSSKTFFFNSFLKKRFYPFYWIKDLVNFFFLLVFIIFFFFFPFFFRDVLIFEEVNFLVRPIHIVPEWYFLFVYAILRSVRNKLLGVFLIIFSLIFFLRFLSLSIKKGVLDILNKIFISFFVLSWFFLINIGGAFLENPFLLLGLIFNFFYFFFLLIIFLTFFFCDFFFLFLVYFKLISWRKVRILILFF